MYYQKRRRMNNNGFGMVGVTTIFTRNRLTPLKCLVVLLMANGMLAVYLSPIVVVLQLVPVIISL